MIIWSEWQDLNLRPPRPERVRRPNYLIFSVKIDDDCACLFTFGLVISVGFLSGSAECVHSV